MDNLKTITVNQAVRMRTNELLKIHNMTQYRLEQNSGLSRSRLGCIMKDKNKTVTLTTVIMIAQGFNISLIEFLDSPYFSNDKLDIE